MRRPSSRFISTMLLFVIIESRDVRFSLSKYFIILFSFVQKKDFNSQIVLVLRKKARDVKEKTNRVLHVDVTKNKEKLKRKVNCLLLLMMLVN